MAAPMLVRARCVLMPNQIYFMKPPGGAESIHLYRCADIVAHVCANQARLLMPTIWAQHCEHLTARRWRMQAVGALGLENQ